MTLIALVRHGETEWNRLGKVQGNSDIPLNDTGRMQAAGAGEALRGGDYDMIVSSPLSRANETAEIIARAVGLEVSAHYEGLKERYYGVAEGMTATDYYAAFPDRQATNAETLDELLERALGALREIAAAAGERSVIAVAHGGLIAAVLRHASNGSLPREGEYVANCSQQILDVSGESIRVIGYNGTPR